MTVLFLLCFLLLSVSPVRGAGFDISDEVLLARGVDPREIGVEFILESRVDRDYRLQGWFSPELEVGLTGFLLVEGGASFVNRGRGLEFGRWHAESRVVVLDVRRSPIGIAFAGEYEVETPAAKHFVYERFGGVRAIVTGRFARTLLLTANAGLGRRFVPFPANGESYMLGARYPDGAPVTYGFGWRWENVERISRLGPEVRLGLPNRMKLVVSGSFSLDPILYRFMGRALLEADL